jgi:cardiolipin synthase
MFSGPKVQIWFSLVAAVLLLAGCGNIPDMEELLHSRFLYRQPRFLGPHGIISAKQGQRIIDSLQRNQAAPTDILQRHLAFEQAITGIPLVLGNKVTLLENGPPTYQAMLAAIRAATDSINIAMYIFSDGPVGHLFADALIERQHHGVQVNLLYDSLGSIATPESFFEQLRQNGIAVLEYRPVNPFEAEFHWPPNHRNHRKLMVVDGRIAFTGGINISEVYDSGLTSGRNGLPLQYWRDIDIEVEGPAVAEFQQLFISEWKYQVGADPIARNYFPPLQRQGDEIVRVIGSVPQRFSLIYVTLISAIINSETNAYITDAYFAPDRQMLHALEHAAQRGVDVRLLLPSQADVPFIVSAQRSHYRALLRAGVKIYEWRGQMLHAKTATIDGVWSTVGTSNLDWWSIAHNNELNAVILSHPFGEQMKRVFENDLENSRQVDLEQWKHRGLHERINETAAGLVEPLL